MFIASTVNTKAKLGGLFATVFVLLFFMPYLAGSRLRFDVLLCYSAVIYVVLAPSIIFSVSAKPLRMMFLGSFLSVLFTTLFLVLPEMELFSKITIFTNYNFMFFALCIFVVFQRQLLNSKDQILTVLLVASLAINAIAITQWNDPESSFNKTIYGLYGGVAPEEARALGFDTFAEFLAVAAHRFPSIFNGMHVLAMFDLIIISLCNNILLLGLNKSRKARVLVVIALLMALVGGALSFSKTFLLGLMCLFTLQLILSGKVKLLLRFMVLSIVAIAVALFFIYYADLMEVTISYITVDPFMTRYGETAYLANEITAISSSPSFLLLGAGATLGEYKLADSLYISTIVVGGVSYLLIYLLPYLLLIRKNIQAHISGNPWARSFIALHVTFLLIGTGIPVYQVGRITPLVIILNLSFLLGRGQLRKPKSISSMPSFRDDVRYGV